MAHGDVLLFAFAFFAVANAQYCEWIRVDKGDRQGTLGTCCVKWEESLTARKFLGGMLGGIGMGGGIRGFINDSKGRSITGAIGTGVGMGLIGGGADEPQMHGPVPPPAAPAPAPVIQEVNIPPQSAYGYPPYGYATNAIYPSTYGAPRVIG